MTKAVEVITSVQRRRRWSRAEKERIVAAAQSEAQHRALLIEKLKYTIKKLRHEQFGQSSERGVHRRLAERVEA
jgi:transposase